MASTINASTTGLGGIITTGDNSGALALQTAGTTAIAISSGQVITASGSIGIGGTTPSGGGVGIAFPATQSASSDANTLDDYEEGTWTPVVTSGGGSLTSYTSAGSYIKIGQFVFVRFTFTITSAGSASADAGVAGLPFSTTSNSYTEGTNLVREDGVTGTFYGSRVANSSTSFWITALASSGAIVWSNGYAYGGTLSYQTTN